MKQRTGSEIRVNPLGTIEEIVLDIEKNLSEEDKSDIRNTDATHMIKYHHGFGTFIRNQYGLWHTNPLTENWRNNPEGRDIRNGCDYSKDHPDAVSCEILDALWTHLNKK